MNGGGGGGGVSPPPASPPSVPAAATVAADDNKRDVVESADLRQLRVNYSGDTVDDDDDDGGGGGGGALKRDPMLQFKQWLQEAVDKASSAPAGASWEANAMCLSTVDERTRRPSSRMVLLKGVDAGLIWYTRYTSRKGLELASNPYASLMFWWPPLERSVRVEGAVQRVTSDESDAYFASRPPRSRLGAVASEQSTPIRSAAALRARYLQLCAKHLAPDGSLALPVPRPPDWGGYRLVPDRFEFWKGRAARLHDRIVYTRTSTDVNEWTVERLQP